MEDTFNFELVLFYILPAIIIIVTVIIIFNYLLKKERLQYNIRSQEELIKQVLPIMLTAHERAILFLERISPENLLPRCENLQEVAQALQYEMVSRIREEYEHNLSQQLYIGDDAWSLLINAKENVLNIINTSASELPENSTGMDLGKIILEKVSAAEESSTRKAILLIKKDLKEILNFKA